MHREDAHAAPSPGASDAAPTGLRPTDSAANPPGSHAPERRWLSRLWLLPLWLLLNCLDFVLCKQVVASTPFYKRGCGTGALQQLILMSLAGCLFALLVLAQVDLHRRTNTPFLHRNCLLARLPIVVGVAMFLTYFLVIPGIMSLIPVY